MCVGDQFPTVSQFVPMRTFACECWCAGEATLSQKSCGYATGGAPTNAVSHHSRMIDAAHHLAAGAVIFSNSRSLMYLHWITAQYPCGHGRHTHSGPGPGGVVITTGVMQSEPGAVGNFVGQCQIGGQVFACHPAPIC